MFRTEGAAVWREDADGTFALEDSWGAVPDPLAFDRVAAAVDDQVVLVVSGPPLPASDRPLFTAYAGYIRVLRERRLAAARAVHAAELEHGNRTRTALLAAVSHDLRTPLAAIKAAASGLREPGVTWSDTDREDLLATIERGSDQMNQLVENLLDLSRLQTGGVTPLNSEVDPTAAAWEAVATFPPTDRFWVDIPDQLPAAWADAGLLERVLVNLLGNALHYAPDAPIEITAQADEATETVELVVTDHGAGVPVSQHDHLFTPFRRLSDTRRATASASASPCRAGCPRRWPGA